MDFQELFELYYTEYRGDATTPATTDPEWKMAVRFYNNALFRMQNFDDTKWNFLYNTLQLDSPNTTISTGVYTYDSPDDMAEPGGFIKLTDSHSNVTNIPMIQPHEAQALTNTSNYGFFIGDQNNGFTLYLNPVPTANNTGQTLDYVYYRKPNRLDADNETGTSIIEGGDPAFYYNNMLASRFRASRNFPAYQIALRDSEESLKGMKLKNNSGTWYNAWEIKDTSGGGFGV